MNEKLHRLWETKNKNDEWWSSFVTSPLAILGSYVVAEWKWLTPNGITALSFLAALGAAVLIVVGGSMNFYLAAALIHLSHVLDCMDGQIARYRGITSRSGNLLDKLTDQLQVGIWFGAISFAAYAQSDSILPVFLAFAGVTFYGLRGYTKYVTIFIEMGDDREYLRNSKREVSEQEAAVSLSAGLGHSLWENLRWFAREQYKIFNFDEGVFIFMLSLALIFNALTPILWIFAISQIGYGLFRGFQRCRKLHLHERSQILTASKK